MKTVYIKTKLIKKIILSVVVGTVITVGMIALLSKPSKVLADTYINLDEGGGSKAYDSTSGIPSGTVTNAVWKTDDMCRRNKCLYFDGTGDLVSFTDNNALDIAAADQVTLEGWFRTPSISSGQRTIIAKHNTTTGTDGGYKVYMNASGNIVFGIDNDNSGFPSDSVTTTTRYDDSKWHHFAAIKNGTTAILLYMDGAYVGTDSSITSATLINTDAFYIGMDGNGSSNGFIGYIDEIKVYRSVRAASDILTDFNGLDATKGTAVQVGPDQSYLSNGLVGYWKMDSGAILNDSSGNNNNATNCPGSSCPTAQLGKFGDGGYFNGTGTYMSIADQASQNLAKNITISGWFNVISYSDWDVLLAKTTANYTDVKYQFSPINTNAVAFDFGNSGIWHTHISANNIFDTSGWTHLTVTYDGNNIKFYRNGIQFGADQPETASMEDYGNGQNLWIGGTSSGYMAEMATDDVRVYNRTLSSSEVSQLYKWAPGPVGYWKLDENTGSVANDSSGNNFVGSRSNGQWVDGKFGSAFKATNANGILDAITVTNNAAFNFTNARSFSYGMWVRAKNGEGESGGNITFFYKGGNSVGDKGYAMSMYNAGTFSCDYTEGSADNDLNPATTFTDAKWHYVMCVMDRGASPQSYTMYVDGNNIGSLTPTNVDGSSSTNIYMGENDTSYEGTVSVDEVKIYNYPRTQAQVIDDMNAGHQGSMAEVDSATTYWKLDEMNGTTAYDSTSNKLNLTLSAASWSTAGRFGASWNGDGAKWLSITDANTAGKLDFLASNDMSISLWFKSDSATNPSSGAAQYLVSKGTITAAGTVGYIIYADNNGEINFGVRSTSTNWGSAGTPSPNDTATSSTDIYDGNWHHIVAVKSGTSYIYLYVDGKLDGSDTSIAATGTLANAISFKLGDDDADATNSFAGDLDEVQVFRQALTLDQVLLLYNRGAAILAGPAVDSNNAPNGYILSNGLVGWWKMDEANWGTPNCSTGIILDYSGNSISGKSCPNNTGPTGGAAGHFYKAGTFDGTNDYADMGQSTILNPTNAITVSLWIKPSGSVNNFAQIIGNQNNVSGWMLRYGSPSSSGLNVRIGDGVNNFDALTTWIPDSTLWTHIAFTFDGKNIVTYRNGVPDTPQASSVSTIATPAARSVVIGADSALTAGRYFTGAVDDVRIYNRALSSTEVSQLANWAPGPIALWNFDENTGGSAFDRSGNSYDFTGMTTIWVPGHISSALSVGPTTSSAGSSQLGGYLDRAASFTCSAWAKFRQHEDWGNTLCQKMVDTTHRISISEATTSNPGRLYFFLGDGSNAYGMSPDNTINIGQWFHVEMVYDASGSGNSNKLKAYVNGAPITLDFNSTTIPANSAPNLASAPFYAAPGTYTDIDETKVYNYARTPAQVAMDYNRGGTVGWWKLDENTGSVAHDASGNNYTSSSFTGDTTWDTGKFNYAVSFDGTDDAIRIPEGSGIDFGATGDSYSASAWFKTSTDYSTNATVLAKWDNAGSPNDYPFHLYLNSSEYACFAISDATYTPSTCGTTSLKDGNWHFITGVRDIYTDTLNLYVDGNRINTTNDTTTATCANDDNVSIGNSGTSYIQYDFNGQIDDARIYNYALTAEQVKILMTGGAAAKF